MSTVLLLARIALAAVFAVAAWTKLADRSGARRAVVDFGTPEPLAVTVATLLPVGELGVTGALLVPASARWGAIGALALLALFCIAITRSMLRGEAPDCHCFGQLHSEPAGWRTLARNAVLAALAAFVVARGWSDAGPSAVAWIGRLNGTEIVAFVGAVALTGAAFALLGLLRGQGRLLLKIDELNARLDAAGIAPPPAPALGLAVGTVAPPFTLDGLYDDKITLRALLAADRPVLLLFTDPGCGPCNALMPQISLWQREHFAALTVAVLTRGEADESRAKVREHATTSFWLDGDLAVFNAYDVPATPAAVLIDTEGRIASPVHAGADGIRALVQSVTAPPLQVVPGGAQVGTDAPPIELPDLDGERISFSYSERETLMLFWNPRCGFCEQMLDELRTFEADPPDGAPRLVLISAGSAEDNRAQGLRAPILLDDAFATGRAFGTTGTPSAVLVDRDGKIASGLGVGAPAVMALARR